MHSHNAAMAMDAAVSVSLFPTMAGHPLARRTKKVDDLGVKVALSMLRFYKREISPLLPSSCCYVPTCSEYSMQAYKRYRVANGTILTALHLCRCNKQVQLDKPNMVSGTVVLSYRYTNQSNCAQGSIDS
ncbi:uncharacterized protein LOC112268613 [Brachypodium distachyon]|uniref:uncharacterized protein LOC112268613 n=1 Tax=Brachypodium distachyon TaxID=15368 RepID=UPI000D0D1A44|nr:uncharacterized protein LOC112268613 [Brachypodium distachyon]|eukprot:XP_024310229.1 uncharacterized protein LOC112268613 [Brachypodium distachyon]